MGTDRARPDTELQPYGLFCPRCGRSIIPLASIGSFVCKNGHELSIQDLILHSPIQRKALKRLIESWESQLRILEQTAHDARMQGFIAVAEIYRRQAAVLAARVTTYRKGMGHWARLFDSVG
jgi:hypothetical protein